MNTRLLKRVRDKILDNPTQVNMDQWYASYNAIEGAADPEGCGTAGCICGWAVALHDKKTLKEENAHVRHALGEVATYSSLVARMEKLGRKALGLTAPQAQRLFYADQGRWPRDLIDRLDEATRYGKSPFHYARVVADRIDRFIKTKGKE